MYLARNPSGHAVLGAGIGLTMGGLTAAALWSLLYGRTQRVPPEQQRVFRSVVGTLFTAGATLGAYVGAAPHQRDFAALGAGVGAGAPQLALVVADKAPLSLPAPWGILLAVGQFVAPLAGAAIGAAASPVAYPSLPPTLSR